ncbi:ABC-2 type transport system permease protein [Micromonospora echinaurantiaca]|uniref:ABC-2 type transport system permease protein n=1 Tax=Micromonospora echinaurantiaca TaxID=47857 RepID=A0A1C5I8Y6_9ACTN|nr:polyketide antibiotic transporter [Micromonospora echinaurantiaca]SCG54840.1 ABC-2 type transport system permease protein [Micromonospora echinaurantiaca]
MTATAQPATTHPGRTSTTANPAVTLLAVRQVRRAALVVLTLTVGMSTLVATTYTSTVGDGLDTGSLAALARNPAVRTLFGEPVALDTAGGFTAWRTGTVLAVLLSVWGLLATTRITRGEEEAGRWDLLLAGRLTPSGVLGRHLAVLAAALAGTGIALAAALTAAGTPAPGAALHATGLALVGAYAVAAAALAAQVFPTRAGATGGTLALLGVALVARMVGDGVTPLGWLRWLPPYGPLALTRPYQDDRWAPLAVVAVTTVALAGAALALAGRRDVRDGLLRPPAGRPPRRWLLGSVEAFAVRRVLRPLAGWSAGIGAYFLLIGLLADSMTTFLAENSRFADLAAQAGFVGLGTVRGYAASLFALLAVPVGAFAAVRLGAFAAAETGGRLTLLHAGLSGRTRLLAAEAVTTAAGVAVLVTVAAVATWLGAVTVGADLPLAAALAGTWNVVPLALLSLGAAVLALGLGTRAVAALGMLPTAGGFLLQVVADSVAAPGWVGRLSPYAHLAAVPEVAPNWPAAAVMLALAGVALGAGAWGYRRRDLRP